MYYSRLKLSVVIDFHYDRTLYVTFHSSFTATNFSSALRCLITSFTHKSTAFWLRCLGWTLALRKWIRRI